MNSKEQYARVLQVRELYKKEVEEKYGPMGPEVSKELLLDVVQNFTGYDVEVLGVSWSPGLVKSRLERNDKNKTAEIVHSSELNTCWRNFVVAKEIAHLIFDQQGESCVSSAGDAIKMIEGLLSESMLNSLPEPIDSAVTSERAMVIGAAELVFPFEHACDYQQRMKDGKLSSYEVAKIFRIPKVYIERLTQDDVISTWRKLRTHCAS